MKRLRVIFTKKARSWALLAKRQPDSRKPLSTSAQMDCTTSTESNLARRRAGSAGAPPCADIGFVGEENFLCRLGVAVTQLVEQIVQGSAAHR